MFKKVLLIFFLVFMIAFAQSQGIAQKVDDLLQQNNLSSASVGIKILDKSTAKQLYSYNSQKNLIPASNVKLLTAVAALISLGEDFSYKTAIYYDQISNNSIKNLYIDFSGDPSLISQDIINLLEKLKAKKITHIDNIYFVNRYFSGRDIPINVSQSSTIFYYGAPSSIYNLNDNSITLQLYQHKNTFSINQIAGEPVRFDNKLLAADKQQLKTCQFEANYIANYLSLLGCLPANDYTFKFAIRDPQKIMESLVKSQLAKMNITSSGNIQTLNKLPKKLKLLDQHLSAKLPVLLKHMLVDSDNVYAQTIARTIGYYTYNIGSIVAGKNAILQILHRKLGLDTQSIQLEDGAGMSENNLLNANFLADLLYKYNTINPSFINLLAIYGETGTLVQRQSPSLKSNVIAKTGTQATAIALSGFLNTKDHKSYIFTILIDGLKETEKQNALEFQKEFLEYLYSLES